MVDFIYCVWNVSLTAFCNSDFKILLKHKSIYISCRTIKSISSTSIYYILNVFLNWDRIVWHVHLISVHLLSILSFQNFIFVVANKSETVCWLSLSCLDGDDWLVFSWHYLRITDVLPGQDMDVRSFCHKLELLSAGHNVRLSDSLQSGLHDQVLQ